MAIAVSDLFAEFKQHVLRMKKSVKKKTTALNKGLQFPVKPTPSSALRWNCPLSKLPFKKHTGELEPLHQIVGQDRAVAALRMATRLKSQGYNIYASGMLGTGRLTTVRKIVNELQDHPPELYDFCYVFNFKQPDHPILLRFNAGDGIRFSEAMRNAADFLMRRIPELMEDDVFLAKRNEIVEKFQIRERRVIEEFDASIRPKGFTVGQVQDEEGTVGTDIFALIGEKPYTMDQLEELVQDGTITIDQSKQIREDYTKHMQRLSELGRTNMRVIAEFRKLVREYDQNSVSVLLNLAFAPVLESFERSRVREFVEGAQKDLLDSLDTLVKLFAIRSTGKIEDGINDQIAAFFNKYAVNVILDNSSTKKAPVIIETSPTYQNLFGIIERKYTVQGFYHTDFSMIKAGSIIHADGGFLVMNALDALADGNVWTMLKRILLYGRLEIQNIDTQFQLTTIKPEPIRINVKVILLGDPSIYHYLWATDEDFHKMFKVHAEFDYEANRTDELLAAYCRFFSLLASEENLLHCTRAGAAALLEYAVLRTESQNKISLQFSLLSDLYREASFFASQDGGKFVERKHVDLALCQRQWRNNKSDEQIREHIQSGVLLIDTKGSRVGQINGLTVYSTGIVSFGKPTRITATVSAGAAGIINIEREVDLSGHIHSKGVLILSGLLRSLFSRRLSISFTASIAFEQSYGEIDGDSASVAEMIALLSAIGNLPVRQDLAITGSVNQKGDIQPVGGVNEKITGFFEVCKDRGLTGTQGVVIPHQNVTDLMLSTEIIEAVKKGDFNIIPVSKIEHAVEVMLDLPAGKRKAEGGFPPESVFGRVQTNLSILHHASKPEWAVRGTPR